MFVGHQVKGTPGAVIQASEGASGFVKIDLDAQMFEVRAKVITLEGYSGHADQAGLVEFAIGMEQPPSEIVLVHGEGRAKRALREALLQRFAEVGREARVTIPGID
ncbi:RNA-metabolising metallo-beta-lactamase [compost metagenome]